ncbi:unnamed protein product [marine sediment metagenome]|uniref:Uncharacterized protein n=1 Tax=marine sediment metagenome TaxID=412755 RepID=X1KU20_9ZZZZ
MRNEGRRESGEWSDHERLGYNYRMDELSAALGCSQTVPVFTSEELYSVKMSKKRKTNKNSNLTNKRYYLIKIIK